MPFAFRLRRRLLVGVAIVCAGVTHASVLIPVEHRVIAQSRDAVPASLGANLSINAPGRFPSINHWGEVAFSTTLRGPGITATNDEAYLAFRNNGLTAQRLTGVVRESDTAAGLPVPLRSFDERQRIDDRGLVSFIDPFDRFITETTPGSVAFVAGDDRASPGNPGLNLFLPPTPFEPRVVRGSRGDFAALGTRDRLSSNQLLQGLYAGNGTAIDPVVELNDVATGLGGGNTFDEFNSYFLNDNGTLFFRARHESNPSDGFETEGLWVAQGSNRPAALLIEDRVYNGYQPGARLDNLSSILGANNRGDVLFRGSFLVPSATHGPTRDTGVFRANRNGTAIEPVLFADQPNDVDGLPTSLATITAPILNGRGEVFAYVREASPPASTPVSSLFRIDPGRDFERVVSAGQQAPGFEDGVLISFAGPNNGQESFSSLFSNRRGDLLFETYLTDANGQRSDDRAIFLAAADGTLLPLLRTGELINVAPPGQTPDLRPIRFWTFPTNESSGGEDGLASILNDRGEFVLHIGFQATGLDRGIFRFRLPTFRSSGDFDRNGIVAQGDLNLVLANWGAGEPGTGWLDDGTFDGAVDQNDLNQVLTDWGQQTIPTADSLQVVPEPHLLLLTSSLLVGALRRRRF